jgi:reactive intermediate/imine deaminase
MKLPMAAVLSLAIAASATGSPADPPAPQFFPSSDPALAALPFSEAVRTGDLLFVSGQIGNVPGTLDLVPGGIEAESRQALENMRTILERHGSSLDRVAKCTVFLADMREWPAFNEVYRRFFARNLPARSALGASGLARGSRVEIECVASVGPQPGPAPPAAERLPSVALPPDLARVLTDYEAAWSSRDAAALSRLFAEDGFVLAGGRPPVRGRSEIAKHYAGKGGPLALRALAYGVQGTVAYIIGGYGGRAGGADDGKFTLTLRKDPDGRWLIMSDMDNGNAPWR